MFNTPAYLWFLLLAILWFLLLRAPAIQKKRVGGLTPFLGLKGENVSSASWNTNYAILVLSLLFMCLGLAGLKPSRGVVVLVDQTFSNQHVQPEDYLSKGERLITLDGVLEVGGYRMVFDALRSLSGVDVKVVTDLPAPSNLPTTVTWVRTVEAVDNSAIVNVLPSKHGHSLHWLCVGNKHQVFLWRDKGVLQELSGESGEIEIKDLSGGEVFSLRNADGLLISDSKPQDNQFTYRPAPAFLLPSDAHPAWEAAFHSLYVDAKVLRSPATFSPGIDFQQVEYEEDPFETMNEIKALAVVKESYGSVGLDVPRSSLECYPIVEAVPFPTDIAVGLEMPQSSKHNHGRLLIGLGLLCYAVFLFRQRNN